MSKVSLSPVRYYDVTDIYTASVDNRPLRDISANIGFINDAIQALGFYQELYASVDVEPPGGFTPFTCVAVSKSNQLIPIDISLSALTINYASLPLYLVIESLGHSLYKCISFSSSISLPSGLNVFLNESIGKALKVGPSGSLVDEIFFDLYYGSSNYQQIVIGKILTQSTFSFGGNQVNTLGDNRFLAKNRNDSTTGLVTRLIDTQDSHTAFSSMILSSSTNAYSSSHTSYLNAVAGTGTVTAATKSPVYFSYVPLQIDPASGNPLPGGSAGSFLNDVHFATITVTPTITGGSSLTSGVNLSSLLDFSSSYLIHGSSYSASLGETVQTLGTSLVLSDKSDGTASLLQLPIATTISSTLTRPSTLDPVFLLDPNIITHLNTADHPGISFGSFHPSSTSSALGGGFLGMVRDSGLAPVTPFSFNALAAPTDFDACNSLILYSKQNSTNTSLGSAALYLISDGYIFLGSNNGVFCPNTPLLDYEITNKIYVDTLVKTISDAAMKKIPITGTTSSAPVTGALIFDTTTSATPNVVLGFTTLTKSEIQSTQHIEFTDGNSNYQIVYGKTPLDALTTGYSPHAFATWQHVETRIAAITSGSLTGYVDKTTVNQAITSRKLFRETASGMGDGGITIEATAELQVQTRDVLSATTGIIRVPNAVVNFGIKNIDEDQIKLLSGSTLVGDSGNTVVTKDYLPAVVASAIGEIFGASPVYGIWGTHLINTTLSNWGTSYSGWRCLTQGTYLDLSPGFVTLFEGMGSTTGLTYVGTKSGIFMISGQDSRTTQGPDIGGAAFRSRTTILVKRVSGQIDDYALSYDQDDTDGSSVNSLVTGAVSSAVILHPGDSLGILSEWCTHGSASVSLLRFF